jgi:hypothetical protein
MTVINKKKGRWHEMKKWIDEGRTANQSLLLPSQISAVADHAAGLKNQSVG